MSWLRLIAPLALTLFASPVFAQSVPLQGGTWTAGHAPMYSGNGGVGSQPVIVDSGSASGGSSGSNLSELGIVARSKQAAAPFSVTGTGPNGEIFCTYDSPIDSATGYHYLCLSPSSSGAGLLSYGYGGTATPQGLNFLVNGVNSLSISAAGNFQIPLSSLMDQAFGKVQGSILYRDAQDWKALGPGVLGTYLETMGASQNPRWNAPTLSSGAIRAVTVSGDATVEPADYMVVINKATPAATTVHLPKNPTPNFVCIVKDGGGNAAEFPITIDGNGNKIDGQSQIRINVNYTAYRVGWDGTAWRVW